MYLQVEKGADETLILFDDDGIGLRIGNGEGCKEVISFCWEGHSQGIDGILRAVKVLPS